MPPQYWVVGASWGGTDHQDAKWVEQGIWMLGWKSGSQAEKASAMKRGDRIAIKRMKGRGQKGIKVRHLGIIKGVVRETNRIVCTVDWVATDLNREIGDSRGCFKSVHGPFKDDAWVREVFCL